MLLVRQKMEETAPTPKISKKKMISLRSLYLKKTASLLNVYLHLKAKKRTSRKMPMTSLRGSKTSVLDRRTPLLLKSSSSKQRTNLSSNNESLVKLPSIQTSGLQR